MEPSQKLKILKLNKTLYHIKMLLVYNWIFFILKVHLHYLHNFIFLILSIQTGGLIDNRLTVSKFNFCLMATKVYSAYRPFTVKSRQLFNENLAFKPHYL